MPKSSVKRARIYEVLEQETPQSADDIIVVFTPIGLLEAALLMPEEPAGEPPTSGVSRTRPN